MTTQRIALVGAGLAGCECALQLEKKKDVSGHLHSLKSRKSDCEMLQAAGISEMMDSEIPNFEKVRELILWSQVYERIERAVDMVSDLGDTLEEVVLKYV